MSYILDALRRAEAQRARGSLPQLHTAPGAGLADPPGPSAGGARAGTWAVAGLGLVALLLAGVAWWGWSRPVVPAPPLASVDRRVASPPAMPVPALAAPPAVPAAPPVPVASNEPALTRPTAPAAPAPLPPFSRPSAPIAVSETAAAAGKVTGSAAVKPARTEPSSDKPTLLPPVPRQDLPPALQRELPPLNFGGTVYSPDPAQRMVLVNGEVWHEGDRVAPGVLLTEVRRRDAVLSYKGQRFILAP